MRAETCAYCEAELPEYGGNGRPARYCGEPCKRAAALEIRRVNARIDRLENDESHIRMWGDSSSLALGFGADVALQRIGAEIERQRERLALLLADE